MTPPRATVVGQFARDLVVQLPTLPDAGSAAEVTGRREQLGGKGANQAVALAQLGVAAALVAVAGDDATADDLLARAREDGIDISGVTRRPGAATGLIVEVLEDGGRWRYLQHTPPEVQLTEADVDAATPCLATADAVLVQLQQPVAACLAAAQIAADTGALVVLDGVPEESGRDRLLNAADVVRADAHEAALLAGVDEGDTETVARLARDLVDGAGLRLAVLGVEDGNVVAWRGGDAVLPLTPEEAVDTTGGGDALVAALTASLLRGDPPEEAARWGVAASGASVGHPGGRPALDWQRLVPRVEALRAPEEG